MKPTTKWTVRDTNDLVESRGRGSGLWHLQGSIVALATGRVLAHLNGVEEVRITQPLRRQPRRRSHLGVSTPTESAATPPVTKPLPLDGKPSSMSPTTQDDDDAIQITHAAELVVRDSLFYTSDTGALMRQFRLRPTTKARRVDAVLPATMRVGISRRSDGAVSLTRQAAGVPDAETRVLRHAEATGGDGLRGMLCASWEFVGRRVASATGGGGGGGSMFPGTVERCDYVMGRRQGVWNWSRVGRCPAWYGRGQCVTYLQARKVPAWHLLDEKLRAFLADAGRKQLSAADIEAATAAATTNEALPDAGGGGGGGGGAAVVGTEDGGGTGEATDGGKGIDKEMEIHGIPDDNTLLAKRPAGRARRKSSKATRVRKARLKLVPETNGKKEKPRKHWKRFFGLF